jgi:hypothetical protein
LKGLRSYGFVQTLSAEIERLGAEGVCSYCEGVEFDADNYEVSRHRSEKRQDSP